MKGPAAPSIRLPCPGCGRTFSVTAIEEERASACPGCGERFPLAGPLAPGPTAPAACPVCGSGFLYWQKDFSQKWGCLLIAIGAALTPWTYGLSLALLALVDLILYRLLPRVSVCYVCKARFRGLPPHPDHGPFDLMTAQTYEARARNWADGRVRPAFRPGEHADSAGPAEAG